MTKDKEDIVFVDPSFYSSDMESLVQNCMGLIEGINATNNHSVEFYKQKTISDRILYIKDVNLQRIFPEILKLLKLEEVDSMTILEYPENSANVCQNLKYSGMKLKAINFRYLNQPGLWLGMF